ncbi:hypothetical protein LJC34_00395 [Oscillospiraceae bacterium OttesenSCG-928-G22]|nr:hypothetical protein [Oscillospiraceae bacterium OttesenSCG-928-G22]
MKLEFEKCMHILENLLSYCHALGSDRFHMELGHEKDKMLLFIRADIDGLTDERLEEMQEALSIPRQREVETNYWELIGDYGDEGELGLVGMMVDRADVVYRYGELCILLERKL